MPPKGWKKSIDETPDVAVSDEVPVTPKHKPRISVLERRLQSPFGEPSAPIRFKDASLTGRWFNTAVRPDQFWRAHELGWEKATPDMVVDLNQIGLYTTTAEGAIARGERGQEVLMYMPKADHDAIQMAKTKENIRRMGNPNAQRQEAIEAYGRTNPDGAELVASQAIKATGGVHDRMERIQVTPDLES